MKIAPLLTLIFVVATSSCGIHKNVTWNNTALTGNASVSFPCEPKLTKGTGGADQTMYECNCGRLLCTVMIYDLSKKDLSSFSPNALLDGLVQSEIKGCTKIYSKEIKVGTIEGREFLCKDASETQTILGRTFFTNNSFYIITGIVRANEKEELQKKFVQSLIFNWFTEFRKGYTPGDYVVWYCARRLIVANEKRKYWVYLRTADCQLFTATLSLSCTPQFARR